MCTIKRKFERYRVTEDLFENVVKEWYSLSVEASTSVNPFPFLSKSGKDIVLPLDVEKDYFPDKVEVGWLLDPIDENLTQLREIACEPREYGGCRHNNSLLIEHFYDKADELVKQQNWDKALRSLLNVVRLGNTPPDALKRIASILSQTGNADQAGNYYIRAAKAFQNQKLFHDAAKMFELAGLARASLDQKEFSDEWDPSRLFFEANVLYAGNSRRREAARTYVLEQKNKTTRILDRKTKFFSWLFHKFWLYGESPYFAIRTIVLTWFFFAFAYMFTGLHTSDGPPIDYDFLKALYFSVVTWSTLGYGDYQPAEGVSQILATIEAAWGLITSGMLLITFQRRLVAR